MSYQDDLNKLQLSHLNKLRPKELVDNVVETEIKLLSQHLSNQKSLKDTFINASDGDDRAQKFISILFSLIETSLHCARKKNYTAIIALPKFGSKTVRDVIEMFDLYSFIN